MSDPIVPPEKWESARLPDGFTAADGVALMAIESGMTLQPWQFDVIAAYFPDNDESPAASHED